MHLNMHLFVFAATCRRANLFRRLRGLRVVVGEAVEVWGLVVDGESRGCGMTLAGRGGISG